MYIVRNLLLNWRGSDCVSDRDNRGYQGRRGSVFTLGTQTRRELT